MCIRLLPHCFLLSILAPLLAAQTGSGQNTGYRVVLDSITGASELNASVTAPESKLTLDSSDTRLMKAFQWAKGQAMAFSFDRGDEVGPWYEAVEPGREGFCMRDVAHQCMGAHALGLIRHNRNMLHRFAEAVSESKDWCSYWEIDRHNRPAPVDYKSDALFWYNLPANFDILDACYRMYLWTGDLTYITDPVFLNFYNRTVKDYVERWGLGLSEVMKRPRLLNVRGIFNPKEKFQVARGIPGYDEGNTQFVLGVDVLATQYQAYVDYARIQELRGDADAAKEFLQKAAAVRSLLNNTWWNEKEQSFYGRLNSNHQLEGKGSGTLLYRDVVDDGPRLKAAVADAGSRGIEVQYRYGDADVAYQRLIELTTPGRSRLEYPETSYTVIGAVVNGTMGITLDAPSALLAAVEGNWVEVSVRTLSGLGKTVEWAELRNLPVRTNLVTVRHEGSRKTVFTNQQGPALIWHAAFPGAHETFLVNGRPAKARVIKGVLGRQLSMVRVTIGGGGIVTVEVPQ